MTIKYVVAVWDSALQAYNPPIFVPSTGIAIRSFSDQVNHADSPMKGHAGDFELRLLAHFEEETGIFSVKEFRVGECLVRGKDCEKSVS